MASDKRASTDHSAQILPNAAPIPSKRVAGPGFTPADQTLFAPILELALPGPDRAARAIAIFDRQLHFQRKLSFHPELNPGLQHVVDVMPPRQSTLIRASALYSKNEVPWTRLADGTHQIAVSGHPREVDYLYSLAKEYRSPETPQNFSGVFGLKPPAEAASDGVVAAGTTAPSVIAVLAGEVLTDTYGIGELVDTFAALLRECYGDLHAPWDSSAGVFNQHDRSAFMRFHRQMPHLAAKFDEYFKFNNLVDEFSTPAGPMVLLNVDAEVRLEALKKYPHLDHFYRQVAAAITENHAVTDAAGNYWTRSGFDHGHIRFELMDVDGLLTPFNAANQPNGSGVAVNELASGRYPTIASVHINSLAMKFGLASIAFTTQYHRDGETVGFENRMVATPELVAPPGIHKVMDLIAGEFLAGLAKGHGGLIAKLGSRADGPGMHRYAGGVTMECKYSPTLEFLARVGDALASAHNEQVRTEERRFGEELFDAFVADYNDARPALLALDREQEKSK